MGLGGAIPTGHLSRYLPLPSQSDSDSQKEAVACVKLMCMKRVPLLKSDLFVGNWCLGNALRGIVADQTSDSNEVPPCACHEK